MSWAIAAGLAVVTGLSMFYFKGSTWGSYQDYLSLFLWGAGVDQGKTFLQSLQASSTTGTTGTTGATAPAAGQGQSH